MKALVNSHIPSKRRRDGSGRALLDNEAMGIILDETDRFKGLSMMEIKRMTAQGLCIAPHKPGYLMCSVCTGRGLMREFLSLGKIKRHYDKGGFHYILDSFTHSNISENNTFLREASDADDDPDFLAKETVQDETDREQLSQCWPFVSKKQS